MPEQTLRMIRKKARDHGIPGVGEGAAEKMQQGMKEFGRRNHLDADENWLEHAYEELLDCWCYFATCERNGGRLPTKAWSLLSSLLCLLSVLRNRPK